MTMRLNTKKERISMMWGFGHGLWLLLPLLFLGRFFWIIVLALLIGALVRRFSFRYRQMPFYNYNTPPVQPSALDILRQRYAHGEIDAVTFDQMRERLEATSGPQQHL
jgi:putative membrane protein